MPWRSPATHGKTTHDVGWSRPLLDAAGLDPTVINGGIINAYGGNAKTGRGRLDGPSRADESDGTFLKLPAGRRHRHQYRSRATSIISRRSRRSRRRFLTAWVEKPAVLRLRRDVPRSSRRAGAGRAHRGPGAVIQPMAKNPQADVRPASDGRSFRAA